VSGPKNGGSAFPEVRTRWENSNFHFTESVGGMTLRDYFAAKALAGDWAAQDERMGPWDNSTPIELLTERAALYYRMADAMIAARGAA